MNKVDMSSWTKSYIEVTPLEKMQDEFKNPTQVCYKCCVLIKDPLYNVKISGSTKVLKC